MKNLPPRFVVPLALVALFAVFVAIFGHSGRPPVSVSAPPDEVPVGALSPATIERVPYAQRSTHGDHEQLSPAIAELVAALDSGRSLRVSIGRQDFELNLRPQPIFADAFQTTLGANFEAGRLLQSARVFEGAAWSGGRFDRVHLAVNNASLHLLIDQGDGTLLEARNTPGHDGFESRLVERSDAPFGCDCEAGQSVATARPEPMPEWSPVEDFEIAAFDGQRNFPGTTDEGSAMFGSFIAQGGTDYERTLSHANVLLAVAKDATDVADPATAQGQADLEAKAAEMFSWFGLISAVYEDQLGVRIHLSELILFPDTADFWPGGDGSGGPIAARTSPLGPFRSWLGSHRPRGTYQWNCAYRIGDQGMWYDAGGSIAGVAFVGTFDGSSGVGVGVYKQANGFNVMMHEVGHIWGMGHSSKGIMGGGGSDPGRWTLWGELSGTTNPQQAYNTTRNRVFGTAPMRNPRESVYARDDVVATPIDTPVVIEPLGNDLDTTPYIGLKNTSLRIHELGMIVPAGAGTARVSRDGQRIEFTPADGFEGQALFSYTLLGNVGNGGKGWMHKGDIGVEVGMAIASTVSIDITPGDIKTVFLESNQRSGWSIVSQPANAKVQIMDAGEDTMAIHALSTAVPGTSETFVYETTPLGQVTFTINYVAMPIARATEIRQNVEVGTTRVAALEGIRAAGRHGTVIGQLSTRGTGGFSSYDELPLSGVRLVSAVLTDPADGTLDLETVQLSRGDVLADVPNGTILFDPAAGREGLAEFTYVVEDNGGAQQTFTGYFVFPLASILSPADEFVNIVEGHGLRLEAAASNASEGPLSGSPSVLWSVSSAPVGGAVFFDDPTAASANAQFTIPGIYRLRLRADDAGFVSSSDLTVQVLAAESAPEEHLAGWWKMDELAATTTAADASGNARSGAIVSGPGRVAGVDGGGFDFDGSAHHIDLDPHAAEFQDLGNGTISCWFRTNTNSNRTIWSISNEARSSRWAALHMESGLIKYRVRDDFGGSTSSVNSVATVSDDEWHHVAVTLTNTGAAMYIDGELRGTGTRSFFNRTLALDALNIGRLKTSAGTVNRFRGQLDDFRIYTRPLDAGEVLRVYGESSPGVARITLASPSVRSADASVDLSVAGVVVAGADSVGWEVVAGAASFADPRDAATTVTLAEAGEHWLRLTAMADGTTVYRDLFVTLDADADAGAPIALALPILEVPIDAPNRTVDLSAGFDSAETLSFAVIDVSNPSLFTTTGVIGASLTLDFASASGESEVTVRATDASSRSADTVLTVRVLDQAPSLANSVFSVAEGALAGTVIGSLTADDPENDPITHAIESGNSLQAFALDSASGELTVADPSLLDLAFRGAYHLEVSATAVGKTAHATATIHIIDVDEAPQVSPQNLVLPRSSVGGTTVGNVTASDEEGDAFTFSITGGNASGAFAISANGALTVANSAALATLPDTVTLQIAATQSGSPLLGTGDVSIAITDFLIDELTATRYLVPADASVDATWLASAFDDSTWTAATGALGYDGTPDFQPFFTTDLGPEMQDVNPTVYVRFPFNVTDPAAIDQLFLHIRYEDGFVAYLNGILFADGSEPSPLAWDSTSTSTRDEGAAIAFRDYDLSDDIGLLTAGANVLAIHGLNASAGSGDFLLAPRLEAISGTLAPEVDDRSVTAITATTVTLRGDIDDTGGEDPAVTMFWGLSDGGTDPAKWSLTADLGSRGSGTVSHPVTGLLSGVTYFIRMRATNAAGSDWTSVRTFETPANDPVSIELIADGAAARAFVPSDGSIHSVWREREFDDSAWESGTTGLGYETSSGYETLIGINVETAMVDTNASAYLRIGFDVAAVERITALTLRMKYDDGYIAFLNGVEVARGNAPGGDLDWDATASGSREEDSTFSTIDITGSRSALQLGYNVLAIHGLNSGVGSSDFLILPKLEAIYGQAPGALTFSAWASGFPSMTAAQRSPLVDSDGDGMGQLLEYASGGDPTQFDAATLGIRNAHLSQSETGGAAFSFTYRRRIDHAARGISYRFETSPDLDEFEGWMQVFPSAGLPVPAGDGISEDVSATIPISSLISAQRMFVRMRVEAEE